jgi:Tfp pilus assembly protein FimT
MDYNCNKNMKRGFIPYLLWGKKRRYFSMSREKGGGFTLIEIVIILGVLMIVLILSTSALYTLTRKTDLDTSRDNIVSTLNTARNKTLASEGSAQYGIYFDTSLTPNRYVLFQGPNYVSRNLSFDEIHNLSSSLEISSISFNGVNSEVIFNRLEGDTDNYGLVSIRSLSTNEIRIIYIYPSGEISSQPESVPGFGRISDSRHVHFDLGWSISGADTLKFDFINVAQIELIPMADYFTSESFDWEGEFLINDVPQKFRVHAHQLEPDTLLCIHRDYNKGESDQEVIIYIIDGSIDKDIAHYDDDQYKTVNKGIYVWNEMEKQ